jgi:hypothetical protein
MSRPLSTVLFSMSLALLSGQALADEYSIAFGTPPLGTTLPPNRVGLGIKVNVDKGWDALAEEDKLEWRSYTELLDPDITPPFPLPNLRGFLRKLVVPDKFQTIDRIQHTEGLLLIVRVSEKGDVHKVDIMEGSTKGARTLTDDERVLAYRYIKALQDTKFSPAMYKGQASPSAFPMHIHSSSYMM